jgi:outer membrane protein
MDFSRFAGGLALASLSAALAQPVQPGAGALPPTAGASTQGVALTATNFVAGTLAVTNGVLAGPGLNNVPPTSILGSNVVVRPITLGEAIALALQNNYAVQIARYNPDIAEYNLSGSYSVYEPALQLSYEHSFNSQVGRRTTEGLQAPSTESEADSFSGALGPGVSGYLPTGLRYGVNTFVSEQNFTSFVPFRTNAFGALEGGDFQTAQQFPSGATLNLQQPLLRNFWIDSPRATILINKERVRISEWQLRGQLMTTIGAVENAYYDLIRARENIKVQRLALEYNNQLLRENKKRVEVGALAPLDEKQAEAEVARGVAALLQTEQVYAVALNNLKNLITQDFSNWTNVVVDPAETLVAVPASPELPESWQRGLTMRPELQQLKHQLETQNINLRFLKNQVWPSLDLVGSYGHNGLNTSYGRALEDLTRNDNPRYSYGVVMSIPLGNRRARNDLKAAKATHAQMLLEYKELEQAIMVSIDNAIKLLQSQFQQVEATRQARLFAQDALLAEQKKYENGKSTSFLVLQFQRDLTRSRFEELAALAEYNKALAGLASSEGMTLQRHNLNLNFR